MKERRVLQWLNIDENSYQTLGVTAGFLLPIREKCSKGQRHEVMWWSGGV